MLLVLSFNFDKYISNDRVVKEFMSFNPYCYWSYLLTLLNSIKILTKKDGLGFNPYCYWSYLLTKALHKFTEVEGERAFQSLLLLVLSFNILWKS